MEKDFYRNLEDQFRGSRESIKERVSAYQGFLDLLLESLPEHRALDLGCGRGELLELLTESGFKAQGVDIDEGMLRACRELNLDAIQKDALAALREAEANSLAIVSALHVVEHLPLEALMAIMHEAQRALMPGGFLLMETPNPENIYTAILYFNMDPSHIKPIPPELLRFMTKQSGFENSSVIRLNHGSQTSATKNPSIQDIIFSVSPDYAVLAQKQGGINTRRRVDDLVRALSGPSLWDAVKAYDSSQRRFMGAALHGAATAESVAQDIKGLSNELRGQSNELRGLKMAYESLNETLAALHKDHANVWHDINELKEANNTLNQGLVAVNATLERMGRPMRKLMAPLRWAKKTINKILNR
jgi:O-antigen chain-terminating methyltransferase